MPTRRPGGRDRSQRRPLGAAVLSLAGALLVAGCGSSALQGTQPTPTPTAPSSSSSLPTGGTALPSLTTAPTPSSPETSAAPSAPTDVAVPAPGPRTQPLLPADMLVYSTQSLSPDVVDRIRRLEGVTDVEAISMAEVTLENEAVRIAAVDPASYRRFTPQNSADLLAQWQRVAGGELAIRAGLGERLQDEGGFLTLGSGAGAPVLHIGAFAPQIEQAVDAVVNRKWGAALGMAEDNALIVSTGQTSPQALRKPIEQIAGATASVQGLDIVARLGLDPGATQTAFLVGSFADAVGVFNYTVIGGGRIAPEPSWVAEHIRTEEVPILGTVTCNKFVLPQLREALEEIVIAGLGDKIYRDEYAGCYYPRFIAGTTTLSNHSFGTAFDINTRGNQRGTVGEIDRGVVAIFKKWGFSWGGDWNYTDPMHFEMSSIVEPR